MGDEATHMEPFGDASLIQSSRGDMPPTASSSSVPWPLVVTVVRTVIPR
jgi:hypothetical protein